MVTPDEGSKVPPEYGEEGMGEGTRIWTQFLAALEFRGYGLDDFPSPQPSVSLYVAWSKRSLTTDPKKFGEIVRDAVTALCAVTHQPYARCACGESIYEHELGLGDTAEVVRNGKHILVHQSCMLEGEQPA